MPDLSSIATSSTYFINADGSGNRTPGSNATEVATGSQLAFMVNRESLHYGTYTPSTGALTEVVGVNNQSMVGGGAHTGWGPYFSVTQVGSQNINLWRFQAPRDGKFQFLAGQSILQWSSPTTSSTAPTSSTYWQSHTTGNNTSFITSPIAMIEGQYIYFNCANTRWTYNSGNTGGAGSVMVYYTDEPVSLCGISSFDMGGYGETDTWLSDRETALVNQSSSAVTLVLNLRYQTNAHAQFRPIIQDARTNTIIWSFLNGANVGTNTGYIDVNHNTGGMSYYSAADPPTADETYTEAAGAILTFSATITIAGGETKYIRIGSQGRHNGDYNYAGNNRHRFIDVGNCVSVMDSISNNTPISLFFCNTAEGLQVDITDMSSDPDGNDDIRKWEFDFHASGKYSSTGIFNDSVTVSNVLTFDLDAASTSGSTIKSEPDSVFKYRYDAEGTRDIELTVTDAGGASHTSALPSAYAAVTLPPNPGFTFLAYRDNRKVDFTDESNDLDGEIISWVWDWGDGSSTTWNATTYPTNGEYEKTYASDGAYTVKLTVEDNTGATDEVEQIVDVPRTNANVIFTQSGPISVGFSVLSSTSAINTVTDNYRGPSFLAWSRTNDVIGVDPAKKAIVFESVTPPGNLPASYTADQVARYGYPRAPISVKILTETAADDYKVDFFSPANDSAPFGMGEWLGAEIPPPAVETPNPAGVDLGGGLFSVSMDNQTYFKTFIDTSGSMNAHVNAYNNAAAAVSNDMATVFFNGDTSLARKYIKPSQNISNERWGDWAMSTLYEPGEPQKQVIIAAINEDSSGGQGTGNSSILAKAQAMFDSGGFYYFILIAPPGSNAGGMYTHGPALAATRVTVGSNQVRWCQWSRESANGGALVNVIAQILGFQAA